MDNTTKDVARLVVSLLDEVFDFVSKTLVSGLIGLDDLPRAFVNDQQVVVFV